MGQLCTDRYGSLSLEQRQEHLCAAIRAAQQRGVPVKYVLFPDEGHGWRTTENRVTSDVEIVRWFETHL
jgi:dipeptidyl aminopeptidase/acylaminoacyl peptidase